MSSCPRPAFVGLLMLVLLGVVACGAPARAPGARVAQRPDPEVNLRPPLHSIGAFNILAPVDVSAAAASGVGVDYVYGAAPKSGTDLGSQLARSGMTVVSGRVWGWVHAYECQRLWNEHSSAAQSYCRGVTGPPMTEGRLQRLVTAYARVSAGDDLLSANWILDDQPGTVVGGLRQAEIIIARILHHYAPARPTICGIGAFITNGGGYRFDASLLQDITVDACDVLGVYVYSQPQSPTLGATVSSTYDWAMTPLLVSLHDALTSSGLGRLPWIGIGQAWGGINRQNGAVVVAPSPAHMVVQAASFCQAGASAMTWYGWTLSAFRDLRSPATDPRLVSGVEQGARACGAAWRDVALGDAPGRAG